jgi:flagellar basal-body rod protein FlgF
MIRGFYAAASGMVAQIARQDVFANNLANANTVGFRRGQTALATFASDLATAQGLSATAAGGGAAEAAKVDLAQGALLSTSRPFDLALNGAGFFVVQTPRGLAYTRDGRFSLDAKRRLVTAQGYAVLGDKGPLTLSGTDFTVSANGQITAAGKVVGKLRVVEPQGLQSAGGNVYTAAGTRPAKRFEVAQGVLEQANVNAMEEMGRMLNGQRLYEANATALRYQDESLATLARIVE